MPKAFVVNDVLPEYVIITWTDSTDNLWGNSSWIEGDGWTIIDNDSNWVNFDSSNLSNTGQEVALISPQGRYNFAERFGGHLDICGIEYDENCGTTKAIYADISNLTETQRTITTVNAGATTSGFQWEEWVQVEEPTGKSNITVNNQPLKNAFVDDNPVAKIFVDDTLVYDKAGEEDDIVQTNGTLKIIAVYSTSIAQTDGTLKIV